MIYDTQCCGIAEIYIQEYINARYNKGGEVAEIIREAQGCPVAYFFFSMPTESRAGKKLAEDLVRHIRKKKLGSVGRVRQKGRINPNSGNHLVMWIWTPKRGFFSPVDEDDDWL